jgi:hypothetical protein
VRINLSINLSIDILGRGKPQAQRIGMALTRFHCPREKSVLVKSLMPWCIKMMSNFFQVKQPSELDTRQKRIHISRLPHLKVSSTSSDLSILDI